MAEPDDTRALLELVRGGDRDALNELLTQHRPLMRRVVEIRMDPRLERRVDVSDVVQEAQLEVANRIHEFLDRTPMPFVVWLRQTTLENVLRLHRKHLGAECRALGRESRLPTESSVFLARQLLGSGDTPSSDLIARELAGRVQDALARLPEPDRDVLVLRSYEGLTNAQAAAVLEIAPAAASQRFARALVRLRDVLGEGSELHAT